MSYFKDGRLSSSGDASCTLIAVFPLRAQNGPVAWLLPLDLALKFRPAAVVARRQE